MDRTSLIAVLNDLLIAEQCSLAPRLFESTMFVSKLDIDLYQLVRSMAQSSRKHCAMLTEVILELGGQPVPRRVDVTTGDLHFLEVRSLIPRLLASQESLEQLYQQAGTRVGSEVRAASVVARILDRHREYLVRLRSLSSAVNSSK